MGYLEDVGKQTYIEQQGYRWEEAFESFVSQKDWKIFTRNYLDDHTFDTIQGNLAEATVEGKWKVYTNTESDLDIHTIHRHFGAGT